MQKYAYQSSTKKHDLLRRCCWGLNNSATNFKFLQNPKLTTNKSNRNIFTVSKQNVTTVYCNPIKSIDFTCHATSTNSTENVGDTNLQIRWYNKVKEYRSYFCHYRRQNIITESHTITAFKQPELWLVL